MSQICHQRVNKLFFLYTRRVCIYLCINIYICDLFNDEKKCLSLIYILFFIVVILFQILLMLLNTRGVDKITRDVYKKYNRLRVKLSFISLPLCLMYICECYIISIYYILV